MEVYVEFASELASAAGGVILEYWRFPTPVLEKIETDRAMAMSPVTAADRGAEKAMRLLIAKRFPSHGVLGEEYGPSPVSEFGETVSPEDAEWTWVLDPVDGTKSFVTGKPLFGTLVALCRRGVPVVGVIDQCVLQERWVGTPNGTYLNGKLISAKPGGGLDGALCYATTPHMFKPGYEFAAFETLRASVKRMLYGCDCYAYALLASGFGVDLVCEADLKPYDYLALVPVLRGAGAVITDWNGEELTLRNEELNMGRVVAASSAELHSQALGKLKPTKVNPLFYLLSYPKMTAVASFLAGLAVARSRIL